MKLQDKLFEDFRSAAQTDEEQAYPAPDQLWAIIEKQLDKTETKPKRIAYRNVLYVAASMIVLLGLSLTWFLTSNNNQQTSQSDIVTNIDSYETITQQPILESENISKPIVAKESPIRVKTITKKTIASNASNHVAPKPVLVQSSPIEQKPNAHLQLDAEKENKDLALQTPQEATVFRPISGIVMDKNGPIAGASISVKGSKEQLQADSKGNFTINVPIDKLELIISNFGSETQTIQLNEKESYMVMLEPDYKGAEVFGSIVSGKNQGKRNHTKSLNSVAPQGISSKTAYSITEILERATPGILPSKNNTFSSLASENAIIKQSPVYSNDPLIVVNGAPFTGKFSDINAKDIEKIDILNESAGRAVFGSRAKNGVIQVTLKQGKSIDDLNQIKSFKKRKK